MSTPRDRDGDAFDDGRTDGPAGWQEPAHLGSGAGKDTPDSWQPPGWDLPTAEPDRPGTDQPAAAQQPWQPPVADQRTSDQPPGTERRRGLGGLFGSRPAPGDAADLPDGQPIVVPPADPWGTQAWAMSVGWVLSDGTAPEDAALTALASTAPVRPGRGRGPRDTYG